MWLNNHSMIYLSYYYPNHKNNKNQGLNNLTDLSQKLKEFDVPGLNNIHMRKRERLAYES